MNDFEYSVEICDRDWECFFAACEECNLLPPSLAGVDDSGMSDIDDTGSVLAKSVQKVDLTAGFSEADHPIDAPSDCEGSPVEHYLSTHGVGGMESVLSGSEEDIHLQSVNIFFERLKNVTEAERLTEPSQVRVGKNREAIKEEERCSDGQQATSSTLPKNIPKLNSLPARGETALGKETTVTVHTISNNNTMKKDETCSNISPEPAASNLFKTTHPETSLSLREEICTETRVNESKQRNGSHESPDGVVGSQTIPHTDKEMEVNMCTPLDDINQEHLVTSQSTHSTRCSTDSWSTLEMVTNVKWKEDQTPNILQSDATNSNKTASQELSPSASVKRKRKKKRRLSAEPAESVHGYDRPVLVKQIDSEEEQYAWRGGTGLCISDDLFYLNEPQKNFMSSLTAYSATSNLPVKISAREIKVDDFSYYNRPSDSQYQCFPESIVRQGRCKETILVENNASIDSSVTRLSQTDDSVKSAQNASGNVATNVQPCSNLQAEKSAGLNKYPMLPVSVTDSVTGKSNLATETNCGRKDTHNLRQSDKTNSITCCGNEQNQGSCSAEVKSITHSILPSAESNDPSEKVSQNGKPSAAKSVLAVEAGNSGRDNYTLCQREAEYQEQLEIDCHDTDRYSSTVEKTHIAFSESGMSGSIAHNTKPKQFKTRTCPFSEKIPTQLGCTELILDTRNSLSDNNCLPKSLSSSEIKMAVQQPEHPLVCHTLSRFDVLSEKNTTAERAELAASQIMSNHSGTLFLSGDKSLTGKNHRETKSSMSDLLTSPSNITSVSSCCTLDTESVVSLSNENITHMSECSGLSVSQNDSGGHRDKTSLLLARYEEGDGTSGPKSQSLLNDTTDSSYDLVVGAEDAITASTAQCDSEKALDSKHSVFAMSSFWSEMEKLTINDILGLRIISKAAPTSSLPPLQESEETRESSFFTQLDEQTEETSINLNSVDSSSGSVMAVNSSSSRGMWESEPVTLSRGADVYPESMMLTSVSDISQTVLPGSAQTCLRKISKNVSVHNLHALESQSFSNTLKCQAFQTLDEEELEKVESFKDGYMSKQDKDVDSSSSSTDSYRISITDIFQYLFGGKQSLPSQSAKDNITTCHTGGNSVPETYDHFFSEFDTESFFYPLITAEDPAKEELVPIFSCSRAANRKLQFPEAYDYFFPSSSSDDSSVESDEEDNRGPVKVVTRFSRTSSAAQISTDMYDHFFTDRDLRQNFFWKTTLSFRNIRSTGSTVQKQTHSNPLSIIPVRQSGKSLRKTLHPMNAVRNQDMMFPDPLLYNLEDRISRQLAQQPFRYEIFQTAVSNPRLDVSLLPLRQSDMCLVCIAFASWVLKTANPQVGDAWKAVLLANVSALSAIRYLRKYVKMEAAANEKKLQYTVPSDS